MPSIFDQDLPRNEANFAALSPLSFIERTAEVYPQRLAVVHGDLRRNWAELFGRCRQLASALSQHGIGKGDTVAVMLPNTPPMVEAHFGIPATGAVLNALNTRLDAETVAFMLDHGEAKVVIVDPEFAGVMQQALALRQSTAPLLVIDVQDTLYLGAVQRLGSITYDEFVATGDAPRAWCITTVARPSTRCPIFLSGTCPSTRFICGRCPCFTATAGAFRGRWRRAPASTSACAGLTRRRFLTPFASTASRTIAPRPSFMACWSTRPTA